MASRLVKGWEAKRKTPMPYGMCIFVGIVLDFIVANSALST